MCSGLCCEIRLSAATAGATKVLAARTGCLLLLAFAPAASGCTDCRTDTLYSGERWRATRPLPKLRHCPRGRSLCARACAAIPGCLLQLQVLQRSLLHGLTVCCCWRSPPRLLPARAAGQTPCILASDGVPLVPCRSCDTAPEAARHRGDGAAAGQNPCFMASDGVPIVPCRSCDTATDAARHRGVGVVCPHNAAALCYQLVSWRNGQHSGL